MKMQTAIFWKVFTGCAVFFFHFNLFGQGNPGHCVIGSGASVINKGKLIVKSNWVNDGNYLDSSGTIYFSRSNTSLGGTNTTAFNNLTVLASSDVTATSPGQTVRRILKVDGDLEAGGQITLLSGPSGTALVDGEGTGVISGDVILERYLPDGFGYRYLSSPFSDGTVAEFSDEIDLGEDFPPLYRYDENRISSGWVKYTDETDPLETLHGYAVNFGASHGPITADAGGTVHNGYLEVTFYNHGQPYTDGFNLAGNPYPSPIDWDATTGWNRINIDDAIYFFNASDTDRYTGSYSSYIEGFSSDGIADNLIPSMQGFFIHVSDGAYPVTGTFGCNNAVRTRDSSPVFHKRGGSETSPHIRLYAGFTEYPSHADPLVIYFNDSATDDFDKDRDALKLMNSDPLIPSIYAITDAGKFLSISGMPEPGTIKSIPLGIRLLREGYIRFTISQLNTLPPGLMIYLMDRKTGRNFRMDGDAFLDLYLDEGMNENRLYLIFSYEEIPEEPEGSDPVQVYYYGGNIYITPLPGSGNRGTISLCSMSGQTVWTGELEGDDQVIFDPMVPDGIYIFSLIHQQGLYTTKLLISDP